MSNDRYADFRAGMTRKDTDLNSSGLKREPRNNFKNWSGWDNPPSSKKKEVEPELPGVDLEQVDKGWLESL